MKEGGAFSGKAPPPHELVSGDRGSGLHGLLNLFGLFGCCGALVHLLALAGLPAQRRPSCRQSASRRGWRRRCRGSRSRSRRGRSWCPRYATIGMPRMRASVTAMCSLRGSTTNSAPGSFFISRMPPRLASSFSRSWHSLTTSFLGSTSNVAVSAPSCRSGSGAPPGCGWCGSW